MIQRVQSIYLLAASALLVLLFIFPYAEVLSHADTDNQQIHALKIHALEYPSGEALSLSFSLIPQAALAFICLAISLFTIFLFKRRVLQIRFCVANSIMLLGLQGLLYYYVRAVANVLDAQVAYNMNFVFPAMAAIFTYLALRGIARDEALVRSLDRLR